VGATWSEARAWKKEENWWELLGVKQELGKRRREKAIDLKNLVFHTFDKSVYI